jgi:ABC-type polysaccharide/polyol phosphate transport system ATPase subunit
MSDDVLVRVENVSKRFCRSLKRSLWYGLQDLGSEIGGRGHGGGRGLPQSSADVQLRPDEFWAVKDVSFELRRGECLGLIGRNGAGKTTLLRMLNGLIKPDTGSVQVNGSVGGVIALSAGFNPILTGLENIKVQASLYGIKSTQLRPMIDEIIDFAEIGDFINSPIQTYSSGMQVRLGFAIAASLSPDVVLLDEVLAVGDETFQLKCLSKISQFAVEGKALILVSHQAIHIERMCSSCLLLKRNHPYELYDEPRQALQAMRTLSELAPSINNDDESNPDIHFPPGRRISVKDIRFNDNVISLKIKADAMGSIDAYVSYTIFSHNKQVVSQTTKNIQTFIIREVWTDLSFSYPVYLPAILSDLMVSLSFWSLADGLPLIWINNLHIKSHNLSSNLISVQAKA